MNVEGTPVCICDPGFSGADCSISDCGCVHGTCVSESCVCEPGWGGAICDAFQGIWPLYDPVCNMNNTCICGGAGVSCDITPAVGADLVIYTKSKVDPYTVDETISYHPQISYNDYPNCDCRIGGTFIPGATHRKVLRVLIDVMNIGTAHLFIGAPSSDYYMEDCWGRRLFANWARMELKNSSMITVADVYTKYRFWDSTGGGRERAIFSDSMQGLSRNNRCMSLINSNECSWLDVTDLPASDTYTLTITVNPNNIIPELDYSNNALTVTLNCPFGCGGNGNCEWGQCVCNPGWKGQLCTEKIINFIVDPVSNTLVPDENSTCLGDCRGVTCGDDGCGNSCGDCPYGECTESGSCLSDPICREDECGPNNLFGVYCNFCDKPNTFCGMDLNSIPVYFKCLNGSL